MDLITDYTTGRCSSATPGIHYSGTAFPRSPSTKKKERDRKKDTAQPKYKGQLTVQPVPRDFSLLTRAQRLHLLRRASEWHCASLLDLSSPDAAFPEPVAATLSF